MWQDFLPLMAQNSVAEPYNKQYRYAAMHTVQNLSDFINKDLITKDQVD
jgi:hypothetical protein